MDTPEAPDPFDTAAAQQTANIGAGAAGAIINNYDERNPYARIKYKQTGFDKIQGADGSMIKVPTYKKITKLNSGQQKLKNQQTRIAKNMNQLALSQIDRVSGILNQPFSLDGAPDIDIPELNTGYGNFNYATSFGGDNPITMGLDPTQQGVTYGIGDTQEGVNYDFGVDDWSGDRRRVEDAIMSRYDEMEKDNIDRLDARLAAQGIDPRNEAGRREFYDMDKRRTDATMQAILAGGQEQSRLQGLKSQANMLKNQAQQQEWSQLMGEVEQLNAAQQQEFAQALQSGQFENAAQAQAFVQAQARGQFEQMGTQMNEQSARNAAAFENDVLSQLYGMQGNERDRYIRELLMERQTPLNEISALMAGGQVTLPDFPSPYQQPIDSPNLMDFIANNYNQQMGYAGQMNSAMMSGLFGLAGNVL